MSYFGILLAVIIPLCQTSPIGYYMSIDHEPPAYEECPGPSDGQYLDPYGNCGVYVDCIFVGTSMEMAWAMPCIPGSQFQYPSVCELCGKQNANEDKINIRVALPRVSSEQEDDSDKSTPTTTTTLRPITPTRRPHRSASRKQQATKTSNVKAQTTTEVSVEEQTTKGRSTQEASAHTFTQTSGHQVSESEVTTEPLPGKTAADNNGEGTTAQVTMAERQVQTTSSEASRNTESAKVTSDAATTGTAAQESIHITNKPSSEGKQADATTGNDDIASTTEGRQADGITAKDNTSPSTTEGLQADGTTANDNTSPSSAKEPRARNVEVTTFHSMESATSTEATATDKTNTKIPARSDQDSTTSAKVTALDSSSMNQSEAPEVHVTFGSFSEGPQTTGHSEDSLQGQDSSSDEPDKDLDSSRANVIKVTANVIIKSDQLSDLSELSELSELKTTSDPELFTTSTHSTNSEGLGQS